MRNLLPDCLIQVVDGVYTNAPHPPEDKWLVKKLHEEAGECEEEFGASWRPPWARHLPARRWEHYHPNPLELLRAQAQHPSEEDLKKKRKQCNDEFAVASEEFKRRKFRAGLIAAVELVKHRNKVAEAVEFERLKNSPVAPPREEYLDGLIQADKLSFKQKEKYLDKLLQARLQDLDWEDKIEYTQLS